MTNTNMNTNVNTTIEEKAKRKTKRMLYMEILEVVTTDEHKEFIKKEIAQLEKRAASKKKSEKQVQNEVLAEKMLNVLTAKGEKMSIAQIKKELPEIADLSSQKLSAVLNKAVAEETLVKTREKNVTYFMVA